jgi:hypothetical protein
MDRPARIVARKEPHMKDTGGHAFPHQLDIPNEDGINIRHRSRGMTLRDYFAAKAMQSVLADAQIPGADADPLPPEAAHWLGVVAKVSYRVADAMLAERSKT